MGTPCGFPPFLGRVALGQGRDVPHLIMAQVPTFFKAAPGAAGPAGWGLPPGARRGSRCLSPAGATACSHGWSAVRRKAGGAQPVGQVRRRRARPGRGGGISFAPRGREEEDKPREEDAEPASGPRVPRRAAARPRRSTRGYNPRPRWGRRGRSGQQTRRPSSRTPQWNGAPTCRWGLVQARPPRSPRSPRPAFALASVVPSQSPWP